MHIFSAEHMNVQQIWLFNQNYVFSTIYDEDFNRFCCGIDARIVFMYVASRMSVDFSLGIDMVM